MAIQAVLNRLYMALSQLGREWRKWGPSAINLQSVFSWAPFANDNHSSWSNRRRQALKCRYRLLRSWSPRWL